MLLNVEILGVGHIPSSRKKNTRGNLSGAVVMGIKSYPKTKTLIIFRGLFGGDVICRVACKSRRKSRTQYSARIRFVFADINFISNYFLP